MHIGVPREIQERPYCERRVGLTPLGVRELVNRGHEVWVEHDAGAAAGFGDEEYLRAGAKIAYGHNEVYQRADLLVKVARPHREEYEHLRDGQVILAFFHLATATPRLVEILETRKITALGYEIMQSPDGQLPILRSMSRIAGTMAYQIAARLLEADTHGGRGVLIPGSVGIPPAEVVIVGAGNLGGAAAEIFARTGASVYVIDTDLGRLERLHRRMRGRVVTMAASLQVMERAIRFADVLVTAVLVPGRRAPRVVSGEMIAAMRPGSVVMDFSIDQGGAVETSRPIPGYDFVYRVHDVIHFSVPNVPAFVPRTASAALTMEVLPYLDILTRTSLDEAVESVPELRAGLYVHQGRRVHESLLEPRDAGPQEDGA